MFLTPLLSSLLLFTSADTPDELRRPQVSSYVVDYLHDGSGKVWENVVITVADGKISQILPGKDAPDGAIKIEGVHATPGLVDAFSYMAVDDDTVEQSRETTAGLKLAATIDLDAPAFGRAASEGVTTAFLTPDSLNAFGGLAAIVKTAGGESVDLFAEEGSAARMMNDAAALKISLGNDVAIGNRGPNRVPNSYFIRRPTTRMGTVWSIRSTFYSAMRYAEAREAGSVEYHADYEVVLAAMRGEIPIRVHARRNNDVQTALRLAAEFQWPGFVIEEGTEAYRAAQMLAKARIPVVAGPGYDTAQRAISRGPSLEEMRFWAAPPEICCEHLHEDAFVAEVGAFPVFPHHHECEVDGLSVFFHEEERDEWGIPVDHDDPLHHEHDHEEEVNPMLPEHELVRDVVLTIGGKELARGLQNGRFSEGDQSTPALPALLHKAGVQMAIGGAEAHDSISTESSLIHQARRAVAYGLPRDQAITSITSRAAVLCGVQDRVGSVEVGKDADLVLWSGDPLEHSSRPLLVVVDGEIVVDNR
ncbi:MAG: amidohydrolase family protein [Planctomycetes bacterium]|nr:amidohydrolase family protein [Planctomycetota bacterium]